MKKCMYKETYIQNNAEKYQDWTLQWFYYHQMSLADNAKHMINSCFLNYAYSCIVIFLVYIYIYVPIFLWLCTLYVYRRMLSDNVMV